MAKRITKREHGTLAAVSAHRRAGTPLCSRCRDVAPDYNLAWRIRGRQSKNLAVPLDSVRRILAGEDPAAVLGETFGPLTLDAVREYEAAGKDLIRAHKKREAAA